MDSGKIHRFGGTEYLLDGGIVRVLHLRSSTADAVKSKQAYCEYAKTLGGLPGNTPYNGIKEYIDVLTKPDVKKVFALCNEVDRRNLAFIKRAVLCVILSTTPDHLIRVLSCLERKYYINIDKVEHQKGTLKG